MMFTRSLLLATVLATASAATPNPTPEHFIVDFATDVSGGGVISVNVTREWAPVGVDRFWALVHDGFFENAAFFRVVPKFVVQFGIAGVPAENVKWNKPIRDDPVTHSNVKGSIVFATAGPNTRTTQLFINYVDNTRLDKMGFAPFGSVIDGMGIATEIFNPTPGNSNGVDQEKYESEGNPWITKLYPKINFIVNATVRR